MSTVALTQDPVEASALDLARRVGLILAALVALISWRLLCQPRLAALIVPLGARLNRAAQRFERLMARLAAGALPKPHASGRHDGPRSANTIPTGRGWLVVALGSQGAAYAFQLQTLLAEPAAAELLARAPTVQRIIRPLARMLAFGAFANRPRPARAAPAAAKAAASPVAFVPPGAVVGRSPGFTWYEVPTPPAKPA